MASLLPAFLYRELCREALSPVIAKHDFFSGLQSRYASFHMDLCVECLNEWHLATEEILFSNGPRCQSMMFVASGEVAYRKLPPEYATSPVSARNELLQHVKGMSLVVPTAASATIVEEKLGFGDWMCEQCCLPPLISGLPDRGFAAVCNSPRSVDGVAFSWQGRLDTRSTGNWKGWVM